MVLQQSVVTTETLELMRKLMNEKIFENYFLVGGTALALRLGHRKSIDIDMFTQYDIPVNEVQKYLSEKYHFTEEFKEKNTLKGDIAKIKIDLIKYDYPFLQPLEKTNDGIKIASTEDIIAMKLSVITDSGTRVKDFTDIAYLSRDFSFNQMLEFYKTKYEGSNIFSVAKALVYFDDIDFENEPVELVDAKFDWEKVNQRLVDMVQNPNKKFGTFPIEKTVKQAISQKQQTQKKTSKKTKDLSW